VATKQERLAAACKGVPRKQCDQEDMAGVHVVKAFVRQAGRRS
jgi:hypothetical protein